MISMADLAGIKAVQARFANRNSFCSRRIAIGENPSTDVNSCALRWPMNSSIHRGSLPNALLQLQTPARQGWAVSHEVWAMWNRIGWLATTVVIALLVWQIIVAEPF